MFDWFKGKKEEASNVVPFPEKKSSASEPEPEAEKPATIYYRFGITDKNRLAFQMGYSEITMNKAGVQNLIDQLTFFRDQLSEEE